MNTRKIAFPTPSQPPHRDLWRKEGSLELGVILDLFVWSITSKNSFICSGALAAASDDVRKIASSQSSSSLSFSADERKGAVPFQHIGHIQLRTPRFHSPPCLGNGGSWIAGSRRLPLFPRKEGQARAELPHREPLTMHANRPLKDIACVLHAQTKDATVVCVIGCQITRTRIHTLPKRLASARHSRVRKLYSYQIYSARFKQTSQWRRKSWWCILPAALILWHAGSDVMGCRRPTGGVFTYVSSDRVTLRAFPVATPRGRSSSSHEGELQFVKSLGTCVKCKVRILSKIMP